METTWRRPKEIPSKTEHIVLETEGCGTLHLTLGWEEIDGRLIEVRAVIGKSGVCPNVLLDTVSKLMSMYLQSPEPRYKISEKFQRQFMPDTKGNRITCSKGSGKSCIEEISERVLKELDR